MAVRPLIGPRMQPVRICLVLWIVRVCGCVWKTFHRDYFTDSLSRCIGGLAPGIRTLCCINANLETMRPYIKPQTRPDGETYYELTFRVVVWFGGTKLRARVQWNEGVRIISSRVDAIVILIFIIRTPRIILSPMIRQPRANFVKDLQALFPVRLTKKGLNSVPSRK
jgi:hypothetical protein